MYLKLFVGIRRKLIIYKFARFFIINLFSDSVFNNFIDVAK